MFRESNLGLLIKLSPKEAAKKINEAFASVDQAEAGRAGELAARALDVSYSSLKRHVVTLTKLGIKVKTVGKDREGWSERAIATRTKTAVKKARPKKSRVA